MRIFCMRIFVCVFEAGTCFCAVSSGINIEFYAPLFVRTRPDMTWALRGEGITGEGREAVSDRRF